MEQDCELVRTDEHISTTLDGEEVILHSESERYYGLNEVGTRLWELLEEPRTIDELVTTIHGEFDVSEQRCRRNVESFIEDLESADLVGVPDEQGS